MLINLLQLRDGIAVVIPLFQRHPRIYRRSVHAVPARTGVDDFPIIVVDDSSPVRGREELTGVMLRAPDRIILVGQPNSGAAGT